MWWKISLCVVVALYVYDQYQKEQAAQWLEINSSKYKESPDWPGFLPEALHAVEN
jgi:hypothetical protein